MKYMPEDTPVVAEAAPAPVDTPVEAPAAPVETPAAPVLYETPDGRQVDAETLQREWKENFLPDYTRKSQELARIKQENKPPEANLPEWKQPGYVPKSYDELIELGAQEAIARLERKGAEEQQQRAEIAQQVDTQLNELKTLDPKLDENALFQHATKYGFRDLKMAHENFRTMRDAVAQAEARAIANIQARGGTPVAIPTGSAPPAGDAVDPNVTRQFGSAREYLASLKGS